MFCSLSPLCRAKLGYAYFLRGIASPGGRNREGLPRIGSGYMIIRPPFCPAFIGTVSLSEG